MVESTPCESPGFYAELPVFDRFADVHDPARYSPVPLDWDVVVTDVEGSTEARICVGKPGGMGVLARTQVIKARTAVGRYGMARGEETLGFPADVYRDEVAANTDFRKFDDTLRMVLDVTDEQHLALEADLLQRHASGTIVYGTHVARAALMPRAITSYRGQHVHFVDGAYALAAEQLKAQRKG